MAEEIWSALIGVTLAALGTGFFLIPNMGVSRLTFLVGVALIVTALIGLAIGKKKLTAAAAIIGVPIVGLGSYWTAPAEKADPENGVRTILNSPYADRNFERY